MKNSIIMQQSQIGENCVVEDAVLDKEVWIELGLAITGTKNAPIVLNKGLVLVQGARMYA